MEASQESIFESPEGEVELKSIIVEGSTPYHYGFLPFEYLVSSTY